ncbi:MAG: class I SAM-dependent rRNA methyltransferase [Kiritimatiellae bacterium]|nr:class I SAM-dependent rRNA methyltransferase [Kiritimatiellia bacterium]
MDYLRVHLKSGRREVVENRSPWIFSGAIDRVEGDASGTRLCHLILKDRVVGTGYINPNTSIAARVISWDERVLDVSFFRERFRALCTLKEALVRGRSNAYRLVHAEADGLPGLVVDRYADVLVVQSSTAGMDELMPLVTEALVDELAPRAVVERSRSESRRTEKINEREGVRFGEEPEEVEIEENGIRLLVDVCHGQKTGFFLDQRANRETIASWCAGRRVLNGYSYTCSVGVCARRAGAMQVCNVDVSAPALERGRRNYALNGLEPSGDEFVETDMKEYLGTMPYGAFDLIVLDPPKFAASKRTLDAAIKGYKHINMLAMKRIAPGGLLFTFSCSGLVDLELFQKIAFYAAKDSGREVRVLQRLAADVDHGLSIYHRENEYLKGLVLHIV